jgi:hypothetical protein
LWVAEAEKRVEEIKSGKVKTMPGDEVFKKILGRQSSWNILSILMSKRS